MNAGSAACATGTSIQTKEECKEAFAALGLSSVVNWDGAHSGIPVGCSTAAHGNINWNTATTGAAKDLVKPVCKTSSSSALTQVTSKATTADGQQSVPDGYTQVATEVEYCHSGTWTVKDGVDSKPASHTCCQFGWDSYKNGGDPDVGTQKCIDVCNENANCQYISRTDGGWCSLSKDCTAGDLKVGVYTVFKKQVWTVYSFGACYDSNGNQYDSYDKAGTWDDVEDCKAACSLFGQQACRGVNWHSGNCKLRVDEDATSDDIASMTAEGWTKNWDAPTGGTGVPTYAANGNPDFKCYARE
jgi:hypothetical protein